MDVRLFVIYWLYPIVFVPYKFIVAVIQRVIMRLDNDANRAIFIDQFQVGYNARMRTRKTALLTAAMARSKGELGRPIRVLEVGSESVA